MAQRLSIPQATLARIRAVIDVARAGNTTHTTIEHATGISSRHVSYAIDAARSLDLVVTEGRDQALVLTDRGRQLADTEPGSHEEQDAWRSAIKASAVISKIAPNLLGPNPPKVDDVAKLIASESSLGMKTSLHRAAMILKWRKQLADPERPLPRKPTAMRGGMWRRIEIRNFRSIEHATIDLAPFTLVVGPNGSGKSNFADAIVFARDISNDASAAVENRGGIAGVRRWRRTKPTDVAIDLRAASSQAALNTDYIRHSFKIHSGLQGKFNFSDERIELTANGETRNWLKREGDALTRNGGGRMPNLQETASAMVLAGQLKEFTQASAIRNVRRYRLSPDEMRQPQLSSDKVRLEENGANIAVAVRDVRRAGRFDDLIRAMEKIVPGLKDVKVQQVGRFLTLKFEQEQEEGQIADFNATEMSEGALRALGIVVATLQMVTDELLIIEEPEVSIHVGAAALLFDVLKEASESGAVLLTTHSADLLDAARDEEILVCEYKNGITSIGPLATKQRALVRGGLFSVAELMRSEPLRIERRKARIK